QYWVEAGGRTSVIRPGFLPAPLHFTGATLRASFLTTAEVAALGRGMLAVVRANRKEHTDETFGSFLRRCRQPERLVRRFWSPIVVSACNLDVEKVAASVALHVFQEGFLANPQAARIGVPAVPLVELYENVEGIIQRAGGRVLFGAGVEKLDEH